MRSSEAAADSAQYTGLRNPWVQLALGVVCMAMVANLQYGWTVFVDPMGARHGWGRTAIQFAFFLFVLFETWLVPFESYFVDKYGPRIMIVLGGALAGIGWVGDSMATSLAALYIANSIAGIGAGIVYGTCVGNAVKWFGKRRGLAAGLTAAGFGAGSALTVVPLVNMIKSSGYEQTFLFFGILQGAIVIIAALFLVTPPKSKPAETQRAKVLQAPNQSSPPQTLRSPIFWVMYVMFVCVSAGGLVAVAQLAPIAKDFFIDQIPVTLFFITMPALTYALSIDRIMNGFTRPFLGWVSDNIGRELTMFLAFGLEGFGILALMKYGTNPVTFVLLSGLVFFAWGEIFSIFPSTMRDQFGQQYATTNYGMLYTAKGTSAILIPYASYLTKATGSWTATLELCAALNFAAAILALFVLRPMRVRECKRQGAEQDAGVVSPTAVPAT